MNLLRAIGNLLRFDRANWKAVMLCFLAAMVFWMFNAFNKKYATNVRFPLRFEFDKELFVPLTALPNDININVSGNGWELFRGQLGIKLPELTIALERPLEIKKLVGASLPPILSHQLGKLSINYVVTDTLRLQIEERDSHRFKVVANVDGLLFKKGFGRISPIVILPDSVLLDGPKSILHSLPDSLGVYLNAEAIDRNFNEEIEIKIDQAEESVRRNPPLVKVIFEVGPVVKVEKRLKLTASNRSYAIPDSVSVWFSIAAKHQQDFISAPSQMVAEFKIKSGNRAFVTPTVLNVPSFASIINVDTVWLQSTKKP